MWHICGDQSLVFSFAVWVPGLELVVILGRSTLTFWTILPTTWFSKPYAVFHYTRCLYRCGLNMSYQIHMLLACQATSLWRFVTVIQYIWIWGLSNYCEFGANLAYIVVNFSSAQNKEWEPTQKQPNEKSKYWPDTVKHFHNPSTWEAEEEHHKFKASLGYLAKSCCYPHPHKQTTNSYLLLLRIASLRNPVIASVSLRDFRRWLGREGSPDVKKLQRASGITSLTMKSHSCKGSGSGD